MAQTILYHGTNDTQEFWESKDHSILILRLLKETCWTAHRNYGFLFCEDSARTAASRLDARLSTEMEWVRNGDKFVLTPIAASVAFPAYR